MVDLKNVDHQDNPWVLANRMFSIYSIQKLEENKKLLELRTWKIMTEEVNQFEEMPLFTNPMNIKRMEKDFHKNLLLYMRKGDKEKFA
jgi:hypothetical protein